MAAVRLTCKHNSTNDAILKPFKCSWCLSLWCPIKKDFTIMWVDYFHEFQLKGFLRVSLSSWNISALLIFLPIGTSYWLKAEGSFSLFPYLLNPSYDSREHHCESSLLYFVAMSCTPERVRALAVADRTWSRLRVRLRWQTCLEPQTVLHNILVGKEESPRHHI